MHKFLLLASIILSGCSTTIDIKEIQKSVNVVAISEPTEEILQQSKIRQDISYASESAPIVTYSSAAAPTVTEPIPMLSLPGVTEGAKKTIKIAKEVKKIIEEPAETEITNSRSTLEDDRNPIPDPVNTGVKISLLGMLLEFTVGNNDSWSTIWKLIVLVLFVYGGLRLINFIFDNKLKRRRKPSLAQKLFA